MKELVKYNIKTGIFLRWKRILIVLIVFISIGFVLNKEAMVTVELMSYNMPSLGDIMFKWFKGITEIPKITSLKDSHELNLPKEWSVFMFGYILFLLGYIRKDLSINGYKVFLRSGKKVYWWNAKCIWLILSVIVYFGMYYLVMLFYTLKFGEISFFPISEIWSGGITIVKTTETFFMMYLLPMLSIIVFGFIIITVELISSTIIAAIIAVGYLFAGIFWNIPLFITNQTMYLRIGFFYSEDEYIGISLFFSIILIIICYFIGRKYIKLFEWTKEE